MMTVFLGGDVMTGRGVDQILPHPGDPRLRERYVQDARTYVELAERLNGPIPRPAGFAWPWGEALPELDEAAPDARVINLETSITAGGDFAAGKGVHYRMNPANVPCLTAARPDVCVLANNHVLDFGHSGLADTLDALTTAGVSTAGAGATAYQARRAAVVPVGTGNRLIVFSLGTRDSGIPRDWAVTGERPGVELLRDLSAHTADELIERVRRVKRPGDIVIASIHWGTNWGYEVPAAHVRFAHRIVGDGVDIVHGHSSHHPRPLELYRGKLILYGCGDLVDDYEGITGYEEYRDDLRLLHLATIDPDTGRLARLRVIPMQAHRMRLRRASGDDVHHLRDLLDRISRPFDTRVDRTAHGTLEPHVG